MAKTGIILLLVFLEHVYAAEFSSEGSTRGQNFVIVFTGNYYLSPEKTELNLTVVAFSDTPTTVTIRSQYIFDGFPYNKTFEVEPKGSQRIQVPVKFLLDNRSSRSRKVIELNSDKDVSVFGENYAPFSADGFLAIPIKYLGKTYVAMSFEDGENYDFPSVFAIVGVTDNTSAIVTLSTTVLYDSKWYSPGSQIMLSIDKGEVVQLVSNPYNESLGGSIVNSDKPVAVFGGHLCANTEESSCDILTEQVLPVKSWEKTHIYSATGSPEDVSTYVINAYYENTVVGIPGYDAIILQRGEFWQGDITGSGVIHTSHPTSVMQVLKTIKGRTVDPSLIQVSAEHHFGFKFGFSTPPKSGYSARGYHNFLNIVAKINESDTILLNNKPMQNASVLNTHVIPGTPYEVFIVEIPMGENVYFVEQTSVNHKEPFTVIVYGYNYKESYGYSAGLTLPTNQTVLDFDPFFLRETGGEQIIVALPDIEDDTPPVQNASCRFVTKLGREIIVKAYFVDFDSVTCASPRFDEVGYIGFEVSLDNQSSFPFRSKVYVAPQDVLLPTLRVYQDNIVESIINFSANLPVTIEWDPKKLYPVDKLTLITQVASRQSEESVSWSDDILIATGIENNGTFTFVPLNLDQHSLDKVGHFGTSSIVFVLRPSVPDACCLSSVSSGFLILLGSTECPKWLDELQLLRPDGIQHCPCTSNQAMFDGNFQRDVNWDLSYFQKGSTSCFISNIGLGSSGQQCCYKSDGNILVGPPGGGSADAVVLGNAESMGTIWHYFYDVLPWISCCKLSDSCDTYYKYRPSDDCSLYVPPRPSGGTGDPHFKSLDGKEYTFNGAGEFLLIKSWLFDTILQARMEVLPGTNSSVFTAFVISSNESASMQVQRSTEYNNLVLIDGVPVEFYRDDILVYRQDLKGLRLEVNEDLSEVLIQLHSGVALVVRIHPKMMSYILQMPVKFKGTVEGLLGNFNDNPDDDFIMPNMSVLSPNSSLANIHFDFGLLWMIDENSTLFSYFPPYDYSSFAKPDFIPVLEYPDESNVSDDAKTLCGDCTPCLFDAVSTGSLSFAKKNSSRNTTNGNCCS
ncbi:Sushi domain-containing protein 2 [Holothuria leucospilota]|uniref:Sushi domain-containing protein 2 n=1 Tax=Holothuria leucospilota TaxID=206669 RepID=A0A9Q1C3R6_HOLLE|nr:Sushi domain-containing protein 2 [Holothuria leucospilota]